MYLALELRDAELVSLLLDALKAFGAPPEHELVGRATQFLVGSQREDGAWLAAVDADSPAARAHATVQALVALRQPPARSVVVEAQLPMPLLASLATLAPAAKDDAHRAAHPHQGAAAGYPHHGPPVHGGPAAAALGPHDGGEQRRAARRRRRRPAARGRARRTRSRRRTTTRASTPCRRSGSRRRAWMDGSVPWAPDVHPAAAAAAAAAAARMETPASSRRTRGRSRARPQYAPTAGQMATLDPRQREYAAAQAVFAFIHQKQGAPRRW